MRTIAYKPICRKYGDARVQDRLIELPVVRPDQQEQEQVRWQRFSKSAVELRQDETTSRERKQSEYKIFNTHPLQRSKR